MRFWVLILAAVSVLLLVGCGAALAPDGEESVSPLATQGGLQETPLLPTTVATARPRPTVTPALLSLLVLHTNDNWGETEPCG
jgi:hypothetical protein